MDEAYAVAGPEAPMPASERLARQLFGRINQDGAAPEMLALLHPEAEVTPTYDPTVTLSADEMRRYATSRDDSRLLEARADGFHSLDDERVIVEGQTVMRDASGVMGYRPAVWALVFRDGLLYRSWATSSFHEAEARLSANGSGPTG